MNWMLLMFLLYSVGERHNLLAIEDRTLGIARFQNPKIADDKSKIDKSRDFADCSMHTQEGADVSFHF